MVLKVCIIRGIIISKLLLGLLLNKYIFLSRKMRLLKKVIYLVTDTLGTKPFTYRYTYVYEIKIIFLKICIQLSNW